MRKLETLDVLDWYDGIVTALVRPSWRPSTFLASLLTWSQASKQRVYGLVQISDDQVAAVRRHGKDDWEGLLRTLRELSRTGEDGALLVRVDESTGMVSGVAEVQRAGIEADMITGVERALEPSTLRWLHEPNWS